MAERVGEPGVLRAGADGAGRTLALLRHGPGLTVSELAAAQGVARSTVQGRLERLRQHGLVTQRAAVAGARGRPASVVQFAPGAARVLAAHVGLTGSRVAVTDLAGTVLADRFVDVPAAIGPEPLVDTLADALDAARAEAPGGTGVPVAGVGVGLPGQLDLLTFAGHGGPLAGGWDRTALAARLRHRWDVPVLLDLDVNLLALAERRRSGSDQEVYVCVKLGTLIDAAIVVNGEPVRGVTGRAGELGHVKVPGSADPCSCGGTGCLDAVASGSALVRELATAGESVRHVTDVVALAQHGHPGAVAAVRGAGRHIGTALATVVNLLNPGVVTVWGYLADAEALLFAGLREGLYQAALPGSGEDLVLTRTALGELTGVRGAAAMVTDRVLAPAAVDRVLLDGSWAAGSPD